MVTGSTNRLTPRWDWPPSNGHSGSGWERYRLFLPKSAIRARHVNGRSATAQTGSEALATGEALKSTNGADNTGNRRDPALTISRLRESHGQRARKEADSKMKPAGKKQPKAASSADSSAQNPKRPDSWRETIESIVVAFVLAFLFRTFEAEAFVIPTGSMAPTLYGQHRDVYCAKCGTRFSSGASSGSGLIDSEIHNGVISPGARAHFAVCPNANCRYPNDILDREIFAGDRILVNKFPYEFGNPERWDVIVFKFPESAKTNYIKRLAGLPGEELILEGGDVKFRKLGSTDIYRIARKTPEKQKQLQLLVYDDDHPANELLEAGWPESWQSVDGTDWAHDARARTFHIDSPADDGPPRWLRYTNYVPASADWEKAVAGQSLAGRARPQVIKDFYGYNAVIPADVSVRPGELPEFIDPRGTGPAQWVGDLTLSATIDVEAAAGEVTLELVEGARRYRCRIDLTNGRGAFSYTHEMDRREDDAKPVPAGDEFDTSMNKTGKHTVSFANVDDRLCLWIDERLVKILAFEPDEKHRYPTQKAPIEPTEQDVSPVGIAARGARLTVSHVRIERDIYYRNEPSGQLTRDRSYQLRDDPDDSNDEFLMLGDNSPRSNDSRAWTKTHAVPRHLLIGKAFFVYWPHGVPFLNGGRGYAVANYYEPTTRGDGEQNPSLPKFSVPFYPQFGRMHRIR
jgi:signal peptidase I